MTACDSKYKFTMFDVGACGSESDGWILSRSVFGKALYKGDFNFPKEKICLFDTKEKTCLYFVGNEAFHMITNMMWSHMKKSERTEKNF